MLAAAVLQRSRLQSRFSSPVIDRGSDVSADPQPARPGSARADAEFLPLSFLQHPWVLRALLCPLPGHAELFSWGGGYVSLGFAQSPRGLLWVVLTKIELV